MSSVTPSDGGYQYYQRNISDLEDEKDQEIDAAKKNYDKRADALERSYNEQLARRERETQDTVDRTRKDAAEALERDRDYSKSQIEDLKKQTYDRTGRVSAAELDQARAQNEELKAGMDQAQMQARRADSGSDQRRAAQAAEFENYKAAQAERTQNLVRDQMNEQREIQHHYDAAQEQNQLGYQRSMKETEAANNRRFDLQHERYIAKAEEAVQADKLSHEQETRQLRAQLRDLSVAAGDVQKGRAEGRAAAISEHEEDAKLREEVLQRTADAELARSKLQAERASQDQADKNIAVRRERENYFANELVRQNRANHDMLRDQQRENDLARTQDAVRVKQDHDYAETANEAAIQNLAERHQAALEAQGQSYKQDYSYQRATGDLERENLQNQLTKEIDKRDSRESSMRQQYLKEYQKGLNAEQERNRRSEGSIAQSFSDRLEQSAAEREDSLTHVNRRYAADSALDRSQFMEHINEVETNKATTLQEREAAHRDETDRIHRNYTNLLERQRRNDGESIQAQHDDAAAKLLSLRQESDFNAKEAQRTFNQRQNELIRNYEKKLSDQKQDYETVLDDVKSTSGQQIRESDRRNKLAMEDQSRTYEQRIAQLESQHKERERLIADNYQEELEKVKRSNALLIQKKS